MIYELLVEGGITREMAMYKDSDVEKIAILMDATSSSEYENATSEAVIFKNPSLKTKATRSITICIIAVTQKVVNAELSSAAKKILLLFAPLHSLFFIIPSVYSLI